MSTRTAVLMPNTVQILNQMGEQIKLARLRRSLPAKLVAERAGISHATLSSIEQGKASVSIGAYAAVLHALNGMDTDFLKVAQDDELGRKLQDIELMTKKRAPKKVKRNGG
jgi:transcriptional regulator with XRE-family HTH domain